MRYRSLLISIVALFALAVSATAALGASPRAVVYSKSTTVGVVKPKAGCSRSRPATSTRSPKTPPTPNRPSPPTAGRSPSSAAGTSTRSGPNGSGQRRLTSGVELDSAPLVSPDGKRVVFERRSSTGAAADLISVRVLGGGLHALTSGADDDHQADFSPDGRTIVFVRDSDGAATTREDLYSMRASGGGLARLTRTGVDEFKPRWFAAGILFSRGESTDGPAAYADVYTMRANGTRVKSLVAGVGSAYVEDVSPDGHTVLFRRDQGLWSKRIGPGRARKLAQLPDGSRTNAVLSGRPPGRRLRRSRRGAVAGLDRRLQRRQTELAEGFHLSEEDGTAIGPVIAWQPTPPRR